MTSHARFFTLPLVSTFLASMFGPLLVANTAQAAGEPCLVASVTFRVASASEPWAALRFDTDYSLAGGGFSGNAMAVACTDLLADVASAKNDEDAMKNLDLGIVDGIGTQPAPQDVWTCTYTTDGVLPAVSDFAITVTEAADAGLLPITASVIVSDLSCDAACDPAPRGDCRAAGASSLLIKDNADDAKDMVKWKWKKGATFGLSGITDPTTDGAYLFCLYPDSVSPEWEAAAPTGADWSLAGATGYKYKDKTASGQGVTSMKLKAGVDGKSSVSVSGKGVNLSDSLLPATSYTAQLVDAVGGTCWSSSYTSGGTKPGQFSGKTPE